MPFNGLREGYIVLVPSRIGPRRLFQHRVTQCTKRDIIHGNSWEKKGRSSHSDG